MPDYSDRLNTYIAENRLIREDWTREENGRQVACLLAALSPEVAESKLVTRCPASIMPQWLAHLTPWIDDAGTLERWPEFVKRYAAVAARWHTLSTDNWHRLEYRVRALCVREAMKYTSDANILTVCERVRALCELVANGFEVQPSELEAARAPARTAAAAAWAAAKAAWAEAEAADRLIDTILTAIETACN